MEQIVEKIKSRIFAEPIKTLSAAPPLSDPTKQKEPHTLQLLEAAVFP